ncbi:MAG: M3 family oligoendopeptidase [Bradymonadia bacterium]
MQHFSTYDVSEPTLEIIDARYAGIAEAVAQAGTVDEVMTHVATWEGVRREMGTWASVFHIRFSQDTKDERNVRRMALADELGPEVTKCDTHIIRALLSHPLREALTERLGETAFQLWQCDANSFDEVIKEDLVTEGTLSAEYSALMAGAEVTVNGEKMNLPSAAALAQDTDRETRQAAATAYWGWFDENAGQIDQLFERLVSLRHGMAQKMGLSDYVTLGYNKMHRLDYTREDVERVRKLVRDKIVPICSRIRAKQAAAHGTERLSYVDEPVIDPRGNPKPVGDEAQLISAAQSMFDELDDSMGSFFQLMQDKGLLDLQTRPGKAGGGYCDGILAEEVPFIFANFTGTKGDVSVFTHEAGHAFQCYASRNQPLVDYLCPTYESCEIHSMSLEYLTYPYMDRFFGDDADRFRDVHFAESLLFFPYGCAVDEFQHWVYENPKSGSEARKAEWMRLESVYLPWRDYDGLPAASEGAFWHKQAHIFQVPFYYIDYVLAGLCALQFWSWAKRDPDAAMTSYIELCARGGSAPFRALAASAGLTPPFEPNALDAVLPEVERAIG